MHRGHLEAVRSVAIDGDGAVREEQGLVDSHVAPTPEQRNVGEEGPSSLQRGHLEAAWWTGA